MTFFDDTNKQAFGKTWQSKPCKVTACEDQTVDIEIQQHVFYQTTIESEDFYGILEVVFFAPRFDDSVNDLETPIVPKCIGGGWLLLNLFPRRNTYPVAKEFADIPDLRNENIETKLFIPGTPLVLFLLDRSATEDFSDLGYQDSGSLSISLIEASSPLGHIRKLVSNNLMVSRCTRIPGLFVDQDSSPFEDDEVESWQWLEDLTLQPAHNFKASDTRIQFFPDLPSFEDNLCNSICEVLKRTSDGLLLFIFV